MRKVKKYSMKYVGQKFKTKQSLGNYEIEIIDGSSKNGYCIIKFINPIEYNIEVAVCNIKKGNIKNLYHPSVCNIGYLGENPKIGTSIIGGKNSTCYELWRDMLRRCYDINANNYKWYGGVGVRVCDEWLCYSTFSYWFYDNYIEEYHLDKDILQKDIPTNEKIYSPNTCIFVTRLENLKESNNRMDYTHMKGSNNPSAKDLIYYESNSIDRNNFKRLCRKRNFNFEDFEEIFAEWHDRPSGDRRKQYYYKLKISISEEDII